MAALKDQLRTDLTTAMKARDEVRTRTLADGADRGFHRGSGGSQRP